MQIQVKYFLPFIVLLALFILLWRTLFYATPTVLPSALIGETVPHFQLQSLFAPERSFSEKNLTGRVSLLNVWASWCYACQVEMPMLLHIKNNYAIPLYSIVYKDDNTKAVAWLKKNGNPFLITGIDNTGNTAIDLGVYGTPETFIISAEGKIVYRHIGVITQKNWDEVLYPLIKKYQGNA